jgi:peptidoglycan/LPS O-acetylase OafA/YrhL
MLWFGVLAYFWVREEIAYGKVRTPNRYLAAAGAWSYSLYLVHVQGMELLAWLRVPHLDAIAAFLGAIGTWIVTMLCSLGFAHVFYLAVEKPSHGLARKISVMGQPRAVIQQPLEGLKI